jgi:hypothetical protein
VFKANLFTWREWTPAFRQNGKWLPLSSFLCSDWFSSRRSTNSSFHHTFSSSSHYSNSSLAYFLLSHYSALVTRLQTFSQPAIRLHDEERLTIWPTSEYKPEIRLCMSAEWRNNDVKKWFLLELARVNALKCNTHSIST